MSLEASSHAAPSGRRELMMWLVGAVVVAAVLVGAVVALGGRVESATWGLVVAAGAMVFALRALYRMAMALAQPLAQAVIEQEGAAATVGVRELREERRRVLRAINELQFDYEMGKLSEADYQQVRSGYEVRAVEVMRALDAESSLHPDLARELRRRELLDGDLDEAAEDGAPKPSPESDDHGAPEAEATDSDASEPESTEADASELESTEAEAKDSDASEPESTEAEAKDAEASETAAGDEADTDADASAVTCANCDGDNDPDAKFCKHCGAAVAAEESEG